MSFIKKIKRKGRTYLAEVKSVRVKGKPRHEFIRYVGKEVDGKKILSSSISNVDVESVRLYGPLLVLDELAKSIHLHEHLGDTVAGKIVRGEIVEVDKPADDSE